jgi:hypothetical protein
VLIKVREGALAESKYYGESNMAGGTKPRVGARKAEKFKDGLKKSGAANTQKHAGPGRASKTRATGTKGQQLQKRLQP